MKLFIKIILILFSLNISLLSQYEIEFNESKGNLTLTDKYKSGFGRYDGYEITLYQNEAVNFIVHSSSFEPKLFFVSPDGNIFKQSSSEQSNITSIISSIPVSGDWLLYVVGDSASVGEYTLQSAFASSNAVSYVGDSSFCSILSFITAHSKAYFLLFENSFDSKNSFISFTNSIDSYLDEESGFYTSKMFENDNLNSAEISFNQYSDEVQKCLNGNWTTKMFDWYSEKDFRIKEFQFAEETTEIERYVKIKLYDFKNSREKFLFNYVVNIEIGRRK